MAFPLWAGRPRTGPDNKTATQQCLMRQRPEAKMRDMLSVSTAGAADMYDPTGWSVLQQPVH
eukprot:11464452-Alexandrium_andersonii.AAC.1